MIAGIGSSFVEVKNTSKFLQNIGVLASIILLHWC